jgi:deazaflavin-dependent oxidoreductase (nitroreductase family)
VTRTEPSFTRPRAGRFLRLFLAVPRLVYRGPIAEVLRARCVLLLTTQGRRTGLPRTTPVSFMALDDHFVVFSGWGIGSSWYRNILANAAVVIRVGQREMQAAARPVEDPERRSELMRQMQARSSACGPPRPLRPLLKLSGVFDYQAEIDMAVAAGGTLPVVEIFPIKRQTEDTGR